MLVPKDRKGWRGAALAGAFLAVFAAIFLLLMTAELPRHRGDISAAEFADNFNRLARYHGVDFTDRLDENGHWVSPPEGSQVIIRPDALQPDFQLTEEGGVLRSVEFIAETTDPTLWISSFQTEMQLAALAFPGADRHFGPLSANRKELSDLINSHPFEDYRFSGDGFTVTCRTEYSGYLSLGGVLIPKEGEEIFFRMEFSVTKEEDREVL